MKVRIEDRPRPERDVGLSDLRAGDVYRARVGHRNKRRTLLVARVGPRALLADLETGSAWTGPGVVLHEPERLGRFTFDLEGDEE